MEIVKTIALKKSKLILIVSKNNQHKIRPSVTSTEADQRIYTGLETGIILP